jgi:hypothetical protein
VWSSALQCRVVWKKPDVSEEHIASIFKNKGEAEQEINKKQRANRAQLGVCFFLVSCVAYSSTLKMEKIYSPKRRASSGIHGITTQKTALFVISAVRTSNPAIKCMFLGVMDKIFCTYINETSQIINL